MNFAIADTGRLVIVENEGNNRLSTTAPDVHIALMGIEKLLPDEESLPEFLHLLAGSGVGQTLTTYVHFIQGPRRNDETDGPQEVHVVLLDNGRTATLNSPEVDSALHPVRSLPQRLPRLPGGIGTRVRARLQRSLGRNHGPDAWESRPTANSRGLRPFAVDASRFAPLPFPFPRCCSNSEGRVPIGS